MKRITVYRIEDSRGKGCYRRPAYYNPDGTYNDDKATLLDSMNDRHCNRHTHPTWGTDLTADQYDQVSDEHLAGCASMKDIFRWFGGYLPSLLKFGYSIVRYSVPKKDVMFTQSGKQVVFLSDDAEYVI